MRKIAVSVVLAWLPASSLPGQAPLPLPDPSLEHVAPEVRSQLRELRMAVASAAADDPNRADLFGDLGGGYFAYGFADAARTCYLNARLLSPSDARWPHLLGVVAQQEGRLEEAAEHFGEAIRLAPLSASLVRLGQVLLQLSRSQEAGALFEAALARDPGAAAAHLGLADLAVAGGDLDEAVSRLQAALQLVPMADGLHYQLGMVHRARGDVELARRHLALAGPIGVAVDDPLVQEQKAGMLGGRSLTLEGRRAFQAGDYEAARQYFERAAEVLPEDAGVFVNLGAALSNLGRVEEAIDHFRTALELAPESQAARFNLGSVLSSVGQHSEAVALLREILKESPDDVAARLELARAYVRLGDSESAVPLYRELAEMDPLNEDVWMEGANVLAGLERYAEIAGVLRHARTLLPTSGRIASALARLLATCPETSIRDGSAALQLALLVHEAQPNVSHLRLVAAAYAELGNCEEARRWQERAIAQSGSGEPQPALRAELTRYSGSPCRP